MDPSFMVTESVDFGSDPNRMPDIQIRGASSLPNVKGEYRSNPNQPLFILDGFEATAEKVFDLDMNRGGIGHVVERCGCKSNLRFAGS